MGKMMLFLIVGFSAIFTLMNLANLYRDTQIYSSSYTNYELTCANNIATSGIEIAVSKLSSDTTWQGITSFAIDKGTLKITVAKTTSKYPGGPNMSLSSAKEITSTGTYNLQTSTIKAVIQQPSTATVPPFLSYAMLSGSNVILNGNMTITDDGNNNWNSNIHANGSIILNGSGNVVNGFGTFSGTASPINNNADKQTFLPNLNPKSDAVYKGPVTQVTIPTFSASKYLSSATIVESSSKIIDKNTTLGSKASPVIYYINGDLTIRKNITFTGYGVIIVKGSVKAEGNLLMSSQDASQNSLAIYSEGGITIDSNSKIYAQLYSNSNVIFNGYTDIHGLVCAKGGITLNGQSNNIYYKPAGTNLSNIFGTSTTGGRPKILSYYN